ncbi:MAG: FG-GAP-like repeat-containing protein [candidate division WOR-3 bacterium]
MIWVIFAQMPPAQYWGGLKRDILGRGRAMATARFSGPSSVVVAWFRSLSATTGIYSGPSVLDITNDGVPDVVVGDDGGTLWCFNGPDGTIRWTYTTSGSIYSTPALDEIDGDPNMEVAFTSYDGYLYVLEGTNGTIIWSQYVGYAYNGSPRVYDINLDGQKEVVVATGNGTYAFRGSDGMTRWVNTTVVSDAAVAVGDVDNDGQIEVIVADNSGTVYALRGTDGGIKWSVSTGYSYGSAPAVEDVDGDGIMEIFVNFYNNYTCRINGTGSLAWCVSGYSELSFDGRESVVIGPDINGNGTRDIFTADYWWNFAAIDGGTGAVIWAITTAYEVHSHAPITVGDFDMTNPGYEVLFANHDGYLDVYSASNGARLWSYSYGGPVSGCCASGYSVIADVDGDTCVELIIRGEMDAPNLYVFRSNNVGTCDILGYDDPIAVKEETEGIIRVEAVKGGIRVLGEGFVKVYNASGIKVAEIKGKGFVGLKRGVYIVEYGGKREKVIVR